MKIKQDEGGMRPGLALTKTRHDTTRSDGKRRRRRRRRRTRRRSYEEEEAAEQGRKDWKLFHIKV